MIITSSVHDNVLPLLTLVVFDAFLQPELLALDRAQLVGFHPIPVPDQVPHLDALLQAAVPKTFTLASAEGVCFRRVAWGGGVKVVYQHLLGAVRRLSSDLLRELVIQTFRPPSPYNDSIAKTTGSTRNTSTSVISTPRALTNTIKQKKNKISGIFAKPESPARGHKPSGPLRKLPAPSLLTTRSDNGTQRPLNIVIYTRGSSGLGRSIGNESVSGAMATAADVAWAWPLCRRLSSAVPVPWPSTASPTACGSTWGCRCDADLSLHPHNYRHPQARRFRMALIFVFAGLPAE